MLDKYKHYGNDSLQQRETHTFAWGSKLYSLLGNGVQLTPNATVYYCAGYLIAVDINGTKIFTDTVEGKNVSDDVIEVFIESGYTAYDSERIDWELKHYLTACTVCDSITCQCE